MTDFPRPPDNVVQKLEELHGWRNRRQEKYGQIGPQLDLLWDDIHNGLFGEEAKTGSWYLFIKGIKDEIEKPDVEAIQAEVDALILE